MKKIKLIITISIICFLNIKKSSGQANSRIISLSVDTAFNQTWTDALNYTDSLCATSIHLSAVWSDIEPTAGTFKFSDFQKKLDLVKNHGNLDFELNISPVNMGAKTVPTDLNNVRFDNPVMLQRFKTILDSVFKRIDTAQVHCLNIGNEYEGWLFDTTNFIARIGHWMYFFIQAKAYAKQAYALKHNGSALPVGTTFTYGGLTDPFVRTFAKYINDSSYTDVISVNYYALDTGFMYFKPPSQILSDFDTLITIYSNQTKPIYFTECGYPSGDTCFSSELIQSQFITSVFNAWDIHQNRVKYISFFHLTDWSWWVSNYLTNLISGGTWTQQQKDRFREYLRTIGLRNFDGTPKLAYETLKCEAKSRNFCNTNCTPTGTSQINPTETIFAYPNPFSQQITVEVDKSISGNYEIALINCLGKIVHVDRNIFENKFILDRNNLSSGLYLLQLRSKGKVLSSTKIEVQ